MRAKVTETVARNNGVGTDDVLREQNLLKAFVLNDVFPLISATTQWH
jgi:hypothetical protein